MFRFANPDFLYLLLLLPLIVAVYLYSNHRRRQNIRKYGDPTLLKELMPTISKYRPDVKSGRYFYSLIISQPRIFASASSWVTSRMAASV